jgi:hypothetical protein
MSASTVCGMPSTNDGDRARITLMRFASGFAAYTSKSKNADPGTLNFYISYRGFVTVHRVNSGCNTSQIILRKYRIVGLRLGCQAIVLQRCIPSDRRFTGKAGSAS